MNKYVRDIMKLFSISENLAKEVLLGMEKSGLDFSECTTSEFNEEARWAWNIICNGDGFRKAKFTFDMDEIVYLIKGLQCAVDYAVLTEESVKGLEIKLKNELRIIGILKSVYQNKRERNNGI